MKKIQSWGLRPAKNSITLSFSVNTRIRCEVIVLYCNAIIRFAHTFHRAPINLQNTQTISLRILPAIDQLPWPRKPNWCLYSALRWKLLLLGAILLCDRDCGVWSSAYCGGGHMLCAQQVCYTYTTSTRNVIVSNDGTRSATRLGMCVTEDVCTLASVSHYYSIHLATHSTPHHLTHHQREHHNGVCLWSSFRL